VSQTRDDSPEVVVRAVGVARTFGAGTNAAVAVHGVCCEVRAGDLIALTGPSGAGKTTLLHLLAGLDTPTTGTIEWPSIGRRERLRPGPIATVFQGESLLPPLDVVENVTFPLLLEGVDRHTATQRALAALHELDLDMVAANLPEELSGGQAQRVAVARVVAGEHRLILADEPTGQLDHVSAGVVIDVLITAATETGAALVVNTHDRAVASRFDRHWIMINGRLATSLVASWA
jgi:putative ABC transport system ATP-binding protein